MTATITAPPLRYFGGKWRLASWIIGHFPEHTCYVEPFAGSAAVLLRKPPAQFEVFNDLDEDVTGFFQVLRGPRRQDLIEALALTPYSKRELIRSYEPTDDAVEKARRFFVRSWQGWAGPRKKQRTGWKRQKSAYGTRFDQLTEWSRSREQLGAVCERLLNVQIECSDALTVIKTYDTPHTLFYVDPPYLHSTVAQKWAWDAYNHTLSGVDHVNLLNLLKRVKGKVVLSGYPSELYESQLPDWRLDQRTTATVNHAKLAMEHLWMNWT